MSLLVLQKETVNPVTWTPANGTNTTTGANATYGGDIQVSVQTKLKAIGWNRAFGGVKLAGIWGPTGSLLATAAVTSGIAGPLSNVVTLLVGKTYTVGVFVSSGETVSQTRTLAPPYPLLLGDNKSVNGPALTYPTTDNGANWAADIILNLEYSSYTTEEVPPPPTVTISTEQYTVILPSQWIPSNMREWDLQYARSSDNAVYSDWIDLGTFPATSVPDDPTTSANETTALTGTFTWSPPEAGQPNNVLKPYYKFRYRIRTDAQESDWSFTGYGGQVRTEVAVDPSLLPPIDGSLIISGTLPGTALVPDSLTSVQIAAGAITANELSAGSVTANKIVAGTITSNEIAATTILAANIAANTITGTQIAAGTITAVKIAANTITAAQIAANTITAGQIAANTITAGQLVAGTITSAEIAAGTITASNIAANTITSSLLASGAVTSAAIVSGAVTATKINVSNLAAISADLGAITAGTVTGATLRTGASGARVQMSTAGITAFNASSTAILDFSTTTGTLTLAGQVTANAGSSVPTSVLNIDQSLAAGALISDNTIDGTKLLVGAITAREIHSDAVTAQKILAGSVTAGKIDAGAVTAGTVAAGAIDGVTITGAVIRTAVTNPKVQIDTNGIIATNAAGTTIFELLSTGSLGQFLSFNNADNLTYRLGFDNGTSPPTPIWIASSTWGLAKIRLGSPQPITWAQAKAHGSWGATKALVQ